MTPPTDGPPPGVGDDDLSAVGMTGETDGQEG
jgi:hypothetical protein